jgi:hypothetical protein
VGKRRKKIASNFRKWDNMSQELLKTQQTFPLLLQITRERKFYIFTKKISPNLNVWDS